MSRPPTDPPPLASRAPEARRAPKGNAHAVGPGESWGSLATPLGYDAWELIDFNFPGLLALRNSDFQRATRQVNWYLENYVGCKDSSDGGKNYAFSGGLTGRGRGDYRNGTIYLPPRRVVPPPPPPPPLPPNCVAITIPSVNIPTLVRAALALAKVELPTSARCLHSTEAALARTIYGESLDYDRIYVSDGVGAEGRPVTIAVPFNGTWIVILNMGSWAFGNPTIGVETRATLIHELAHAWQSQHHSDPLQFMFNCAKSQAAAGAASLVAKATSSKWVQIGSRLGGGPGVPDLKLGPADAYSYVPGKFFGDYGGEQTAQQVEDHYRPPTPPKSRHLTSSEAGSIATIAAYMKNAGKNAVVGENVRSLGSIKFVHQNYAGVVWHD